MGFGFLIARFSFWMHQYALMVPSASPQRLTLSPWLGFGMVVVGVCVSLLAAARHRDYIRALRNGVSNPPMQLAGALAVAGVLALVGLAMAIQIALF
jgi:putative membrane protein